MTDLNEVIFKGLFYTEIKRLVWDTAVDDGTGRESRALLIELINQDGTAGITIKFIDVWKLELSCVAGQISGLCIKDFMTFGYEIENRYYVNDFEEEVICFYCQDIQVLERK